MRDLLCIAVVAVGIPVLADDSSRIAELERRLQELDQKYRALEAKVGESPEVSKAPPTVSMGSEGIHFQSADTNFALNFHSVFQLDTHWYLDGGGNDSFLLRRARPLNIDGTFFHNLDFYFVPEFGNGKTSGGTATASAFTVLDAYLNYRVAPEFQIQIGKMKEPVGLEQLQRETTLFLMERSLVFDLLPNRDLGVMVHGDVADGVATYQAGFFNGLADGATTANLDFDDQKELAGRIFLEPFQLTEIKALKKLGLGIGATIGSASGAGAVGSYATESLVTFFNYKAGVVGAGQHFRWAPQMNYYYGPFGMMAEYAVSSQEVRLGAVKGRMDHRAWQIAGGYVLTGEEATPKGIIPAKPFSLTEGHFGAVEIVGRYSYLDIDDGAFPTFASAAANATRAAAVSGGLNWYLNRNVKTMLNYVHTDFKGGAGNRSTLRNEDAFMTRFQLSF